MAMSNQERDFFIPLLQDTIRAGSIETLLTYKETLRDEFIPTVVLALQNSEAQDQLYARLLHLDPRFCLEILQQPAIQNTLKDSLALSKEILQAAKIYPQLMHHYVFILIYLTSLNPTILTTPLQNEDQHSSFLHQAILNPQAAEFHFLRQQNLWTAIPRAYQLFLQEIHPQYFQNLPLAQIDTALVLAASVKPTDHAPTALLDKLPQTSAELDSATTDPQKSDNMNGAESDTAASAGTTDDAQHFEIIEQFCDLFREDQGLAEFKDQHQKTLELAFQNEHCRGLFLDTALDEANTNMLTEIAQIYPSFTQEPYQEYASFFACISTENIELALFWLLKHQHLLQPEQQVQLIAITTSSSKKICKKLSLAITKDKLKNIINLCNEDTFAVQHILETPNLRDPLLNNFFTTGKENTAILDEFLTFVPECISQIITLAETHRSLGVITWLIDSYPQLSKITLTRLEQLQADLEIEATLDQEDITDTPTDFTETSTVTELQLSEKPKRRRITPTNEQQLDAQKAEISPKSLELATTFYKEEPKPKLVNQELKPGDRGFRGYHFDHGLNGAHLHETDALIPFWLMQFSDELEAAGYALMQIERINEELVPEQVAAVLNGMPFLRITSYDFENNFSIPEEKAFSKALKTLLYPINQGNKHYGCLLLHFNDQNEIEICIYFEPLSRNYTGSISVDVTKLVEKLVESGQFGNPEILRNPTMIYMGQEDEIHCGDHVTAILEAFAHQRINISEFLTIKTQITDSARALNMLDQNRLAMVAVHHNMRLTDQLTDQAELQQGIHQIIATTEEARQRLVEQYHKHLQQAQAIWVNIAGRALSRDEIELIRSLIVLSLNPENYEAQLHASYQPRDEAHLQENFAKIKQKLPELIQRVHTLQFKVEFEPNPSKVSTSPQPFLTHTTSSTENHSEASAQASNLSEHIAKTPKQ